MDDNYVVDVDSIRRALDNGHYGHGETADDIRDLLSELAIEAGRANAAEHAYAELRSLIESPQVNDFMEAVRLEAAHQQERWSADHEAGKADSDWFWLIGYLAGKAIRPDTTQEKRLHHIITTAAACLNWHAHATGARTAMRPGIEPPDGDGANKSDTPAAGAEVV